MPDAQLEADSAEHPPSAELLARLMACRLQGPADQLLFEVYFDSISNTATDRYTALDDAGRAAATLTPRTRPGASGRLHGSVRSRG